jgi:hypothetical protein
MVTEPTAVPEADRGINGTNAQQKSRFVEEPGFLHAGLRIAAGGTFVMMGVGCCPVYGRKSFEIMDMAAARQLDRRSRDALNRMVVAVVE